jgi:hypothetical protein
MPNAQATVVQRLQGDAGQLDPAPPTGDATVVIPMRVRLQLPSQ